MNRYARIALIASTTATLALTTAGIASAKKLCLAQGSFTMFFPKAKIPKAGGVFPLVGQSTGGVLLTGAVRANAAGTTTVVTLFATAGTVGSSFRYTWAGDNTLAGTGGYDLDGDNVSDGSATFTVVDCATVTIP